MAFLIFGAILFGLSTLALMTFLGLWTYSDAKVKSNENPVMWTLIVVVSGLIELIIYCVAGRKKEEKSPGDFKKALIAAFVSCVVSFLLYISSFIMFIMETA